MVPTQALALSHALPLPLICALAMVTATTALHRLLSRGQVEANAALLAHLPLPPLRGRHLPLWLLLHLLTLLAHD